MCLSVSTLIENVVKLTPVMFTVMLGCFGAYIAFRQHIIARDKLKLDLFEKRYAVYEKVQKFYATVLRRGGIEEADITSLALASHESTFLFGDDLQEDLNNLYKMAIDLDTFSSIIEQPSSKEERKEYILKRQNLKKSINKASSTTLSLFKKYMSFQN